MSDQTQTPRYTSWLWPDHAIGIKESRQLREEHNALVNSHAELVAACVRASFDIHTHTQFQDTRNSLDAAIANAQPAQGDPR